MEEEISTIKNVLQKKPRMDNHRGKIKRITKLNLLYYLLLNAINLDTILIIKFDLSTYFV